MSKRAKINTIKTFTTDDHPLKLRLDLEIHLRKVTMYDQVFLDVFSFFPLEMFKIFCMCEILRCIPLKIFV